MTLTYVLFFTIFKLLWRIGQTITFNRVCLYLTPSFVVNP